MFRKKAPEVPLPRKCTFTAQNIISDVEAVVESKFADKGKAFSNIPSRNEKWAQQIKELTETSNNLKEQFNKAQDLHEQLLEYKDQLENDVKNLKTRSVIN